MSCLCFSGMIWTAPEVLRMAKDQQGHGTQKGDVYSFAIICQEMLTRSGPFDMSYYHTEPKGNNGMISFNHLCSRSYFVCFIY